MSPIDLPIKSARDLVLLLYRKEADMKTLKSKHIGVWYWKAKLWYDESICKCRKKGLSQDTVDNEYKNLINMSESDKQEVVNLLGGKALILYLNEHFVGRIE